MQRLRELARTYAFDLVIVLLVLIAMVDTVFRLGSVDSASTSLAFALPAMGILALVIVAHRRFPFGGPAAYWLLAAGIAFADPLLLPSAESFFAVGLATAFLLGDLRDLRKAGIGLAIILASTAILVAQIPGHTTAEVFFIPLDFAICWFAGFMLRETADQAQAAEARAIVAEREREADALRAVVEERTRIARELHDIVGHSVSVMTVQVSGVRRLLRPEQEQEREALLAVERTGREALAEMRRVVGALRDPEEGPALAPQPSLSRVEALVAHARETGLPVDLEIEGEPIPLPAGVDLTAYRLVQEGLTNSIKHAAASRAGVRVRYDAEHVEIEVSDDGRGAAAAGTASNGGGHGLVGMRERVSIFGGHLEAGPRAEGGFRLRARLPVAT
jgi:signal transduction histidine kinase